MKLHKPSDQEITSAKHTIRGIIFRHDTPASKTFDLLLLCLILISVALVLIESVNSIYVKYAKLLNTWEWIITILFTIEYVLRIWTVSHRRGYLFSFYGIVDLISILPTYLGLFFYQSQYFTIIRALRLLRIFKILKLQQFLGESEMFIFALRRSIPKITVFLTTVLTLTMIIGAVMFLIEGPENGFTSIPRGIYWAIVTLTTVGYGDISPGTPFGQLLASLVMILGYGIIAVPTGIVTTDMMEADKKSRKKKRKIEKAKEEEAKSRICPVCEKKGHDLDATFCKHCGNEL